MNKKAFTLIELLVVIAIIAILAAILFPVFAQAKEAAKKTAAISNAKQVGTAFNIYVSDYDDQFPSANMTSAGSWATFGADYPNNWRSSAFATTADFQDRHGQFWANSIQPYMRNLQLLELQSSVSLVDVFTAGEPAQRARGKASLTMNGLLSYYSTTAVNEVSGTPLLWYGYGKQTYDGISFQNPYLRCSGATSGGCSFKPGQIPGGTSTSVFGHVRRSWTTPSLAVFTGGMIFTATDSSTKFRRLANPGTTGNTNRYDPYSAYNAAGAGTASISCRRPGETVYYWCLFRPDWDFTFSGWELI